MFVLGVIHIKTCVLNMYLLHMYYTYISTHVNTCVGYTPLSYDYCWDCNFIGWFFLNIKPQARNLP